MQKYFNTIESIDSFTLSLDYHKNKLQCHHCKKNNQFVSHGFIYKQRSMKLSEPVGKRIICSNRYGRSGCGRTFQLYVAEEFPSFHYGSIHLVIFITSLLKNLTVHASYQKATGQLETRNAWRWLNKLMIKLTDYRRFLKARTQIVSTLFISKAKRLQLLLPTLTRFFNKINGCPCSYYQQNHQLAFIWLLLLNLSPLLCST